jgi:hypothetical protein
MANGLQAYQGPDGAFYSWSGTVMSPLTGTLITASGQSATIQQGYPVQPSTQYASTQPGLYSNTQAGVSPYASSYTPTAAAAQAPAQTAGVSTSGLPAWLPWAAIGGTALLLFATARPLRGGNYKRARS